MPRHILTPILGHWTLDTGVHTESWEPNIPTLKQTKGHLHEESCRKGEGMTRREGEGGCRGHQLEATGSSGLPAPLSYTYICTYTP